jgi:uncharacterized membrane-anchored protein YitT (DUF2179 family)
MTILHKHKGGPWDKLTQEAKTLKFSWDAVKDIVFLLFGAFLQGMAMHLFLVPAQLVSGGISGIAQIANYYSAWPIGMMTLIGNIPLFIVGWRYLGGLRFALRTATAVIAFSFFTDWLVLLIAPGGITNDIVLNALYGGILYGVGSGIVYRGKGTSGGSDILSRILNFYLGIPISHSYLIVDTLVVLGGGFTFGWDIALYGIIAIYVSGIGAEAIAEGRSVFRSAIIITTKPSVVADRIMTILERGVTILPGTGAYTGDSRPVLYSVVVRSEVHKLKQMVVEADPNAFLVIGQASEAMGEGFLPLSPIE